MFCLVKEQDQFYSYKMKLRSNQNLKKRKKEQLTFENRPCRQILMVCLMKTKVNRMKLDFPRQKTNVYTNSWCNNILLTRLVQGNHQNE